MIWEKNIFVLHGRLLLPSLFKFKGFVLDGRGTFLGKLPAKQQVPEPKLTNVMRAIAWLAFKGQRCYEPGLDHWGPCHDVCASDRKREVRWC